MENNKSKKLFSLAQALMPGGVNSPVRAFKSVGGSPLVFVKGDGAYVIDADGNKYIDYCSSWGPLILGHAHPKVVSAIQRTAAEGTSFGTPNPLENELAELIIEAIPSMEKIRFVNSGTEATMSAIRLARAYTGKNKIIKFSGCYHGHSDGLLADSGSGLTTLGIPSSPGVSQETVQHTLNAEFNNIESVEHLFTQFPTEIAAVIVEPIAGNMGVIPPKPGFLEGLRKITHRTNSMLIFDEVITGFRVGFGGAQSIYKIQPDITCLGKIIGGGLPVGAYGGRNDVMKMIAPEGPVYQAGTLSGNPMAMAAGIATLKELQNSGVYEILESLGKIMETGLKEILQNSNREVQISRAGSMVCLFFCKTPITNYRDVQQCNTKKFGKYFREMLNRGIYLPPSQFETNFVSLAHKEEDIKKTLNSIKEIIHKIV